MRKSYETNLHFAICAEDAGYVYATSAVANPRKVKMKRLNRLYRYLRRVFSPLNLNPSQFVYSPRHAGKNSRRKIINVFQHPPVLKLPYRRVYERHPFVINALVAIRHRQKHQWDIQEFINEYRALCDNEGIGPRLVVVEQKHQIEFQVYDQGPSAAPRIVTYTRS